MNYQNSFTRTGLLQLTEEVAVQQIEKKHLLQLFSTFGLLVFLGTSHLRIVRFRKHYNNSYFSTFRQNIATSNQIFTYAFLKCFSQILKAIIKITNNDSNILYSDLPFTIVGKYFNNAEDFEGTMYKFTSI